MRSFEKLARVTNMLGGCNDPRTHPLAPVPTQGIPAHLDTQFAGCLTFSGHRGIHEGPSSIGLHLVHLVFQQVHQDGDDIILTHLLLALQRDARPERGQFGGFAWVEERSRTQDHPKGTPEKRTCVETMPGGPGLARAWARWGQESTDVRFGPHSYTQTTWEQGLGPLKVRLLRSQRVMEVCPNVSGEGTRQIPRPQNGEGQDPGWKPQGDSFCLHKSPSDLPS